MKYFTEEFIEFFKELEKNNVKEWFHDNKKRYENHVKKPMLALVSDLVEEMKKRDSEIDVEPKKCIGRINRDIRFSKDKTPYNIHYMAHVIKGTKADPTPGIAFRFGGKDGGIMSGYYTPGKDRIYSIRQQILADPEGFKKLYSSKKFIEKFGSIKGEKNKRIPPEFRDVMEKEELIANKQFYYVSDFGPEFILKEDLLPAILEHWEAARPMNDFLTVEH